MAERQPLQVVAQVQTGAPHDGDGSEAGIISAFTDHIGNSLVPPKERHLMNEMGVKFVEVRVSPGAGGNRAFAVIEDALVRGQAFALRIAQHLTAIELVESVSARPSREPHGAGAEKLLQFLYG